MEQKRVPEPKPMQETISPVLPRRRFSSAESDSEAPNAGFATASTTPEVALIINSRRDQRDFIKAPFLLDRRSIEKLSQIVGMREARTYLRAVFLFTPDKCKA